MILLLSEPAQGLVFIQEFTICDFHQVLSCLYLSYSILNIELCFPCGVNLSKLHLFHFNSQLLSPFQKVPEVLVAQVAMETLTLGEYNTEMVLVNII